MFFYIAHLFSILLVNKEKEILSYFHHWKTYIIGFSDCLHLFLIVLFSLKLAEQG